MNRKTRNMLRKIFNKYDPIKIYLGKENFDEYDLEIDMIVNNFRYDMKRKDFLFMVRSVFIEMFDEKLAGPKSRYIGFAKEIYNLLTKNIKRNST